MSVDWTWTYLKYLPIKWQGGTGGCVEAGLTYAMEMRAMLQGYPPRQLSMRFLLWQAQELFNGVHNVGGSYPNLALDSAKNGGVCIESLMPMPAWQGIDTTTQAYSTLTWAAVQTPPSAAAVADAPNQKLTDFAYFSYDGTLADLKLKAQTAIAAGYPLLIRTATGTHDECAWGYDDSGLIGLDSRSQNADSFHMAWDQIGGIVAIVRGVKLANAVIGSPLTVPLPKPVVVPPPPPPVGNTQMLIDTYKTQVNALQLGQITAAQLAAIDATRAQIVPDAGPVPVPVPVPPPPPVPPAPAGDWTVPPSVSGTDSSGAVWTLGAVTPSGKQVLRNGASAAGGQAALISYVGGKIVVQNSSGAQYEWHGGTNGYWTVPGALVP